MLWRNKMIINLVSLYGIQIATLLLPLATLPYLSRVLGPNSFGELSAAQAFSITLSIFVEYGFVFSATRSISSNKNDINYISRVSSEVLSAKIILSFFVILIGIVFIVNVEQFRNQWQLFFLSILYSIVQGFSPFWYFQGIENLRTAVLVELVFRFIFTVLLFLVVKTPSQVWLVVFLQLLSVLISQVINHIRMYRQINYYLPNLRDAISGLKNGWSMFLFRASVSLYTSANTFILRLYVPSAEVADYSSADKLTGAPKSVLQPIIQVLFPRISSLIGVDDIAAVQVVRKGASLLISVSFILCFFMWFLLPSFIPWFFGKEYTGAIGVGRILSLTIPVIAISNILGLQWMLPNKMDRAFNTFIVLGGIFNILFIVLLVPQYGKLGMAYSVLSSEIIIVIGMLIFLIKRKSLLFVNLRRL